MKVIDPEAPAPHPSLSRKERGMRRWGFRMISWTAYFLPMASVIRRTRGRRTVGSIQRLRPAKDRKIEARITRIQDFQSAIREAGNGKVHAEARGARSVFGRDLTTTFHFRFV